MSTKLAHSLGCEGEVLHFRYGGGTTPGSYRLVYVLGYKGIGQRTLQCWDFDRREPRCFCQTKMTDITRLEQSVRKLDISNLPAGVDIELLVKGYAEEDCDVYYDNSVVVAIRKKKACLKHEHFANGTTLRVVGKTGVSLVLTMNKGNIPTLEIYGRVNGRLRFQRNPTPENLRDALDRVIDG